MSFIPAWWKHYTMGHAIIRLFPILLLLTSVGTLKSTMVGIVSAWKLTQATMQGFLSLSIPEVPVAKHLSAPH